MVVDEEPLAIMIRTTEAGPATILAPVRGNVYGLYHSSRTHMSAPRHS